MKALHDLVQSGKVRYIGASSMWTWQFAHYNHVAEKDRCPFTLPIPACRSTLTQNGWTKFVSMQGQYSLLYRYESLIRALCHSRY
jgi:aryl-alcohol dehydrogenase-like predicted oxidoreductase